MSKNRYNIEQIYLYNGDFYNPYYITSRNKGIYECQSILCEDHDTMLIDDDMLSNFQPFPHLLAQFGFLILPLKRKISMKQYLEWTLIIQNISKMPEERFWNYQYTVMEASNWWGDYLLQYNQNLDEDELNDFVFTLREFLLYHIFLHYLLCSYYINFNLPLLKLYLKLSSS